MGEQRESDQPPTVTIQSIPTLTGYNSTVRRALLFIALLLWFGAAASVATAWLYASVPHESDGRNRLSPWSASAAGKYHDWWIDEWRGPGKRVRLLRYPLSAGPLSEDGSPFPWSVPRWSAAHEPPGRSERWIVESARGWPWPSLRCSWVDPPFHVPGKPRFPPYVLPAERLTAGVAAGELEMLEGLVDRWPTQVHAPPPGVEDDLRALPLRPLWMGFAGSMIFWSSIGVGILTVADAPAMLVRLRRRRLGRCVRCRYPLRELTSKHCPECGLDVRGRLPMLRASRLRTAAELALLSSAAAATVGVMSVRAARGSDPIHVAARWNDTDQLARLLARGANVDEPSHVPGYFAPWEATPLMWAAAHGNLESMRLLVEEGAEPSRGLVTAAQHDQRGAVVLLLSLRPELVTTSGGHEALANAAAAGAVDLMRSLIDAGVPVTPPGDQPSALGTAVIWYQDDVVEMLLAAGADPNVNFGEALFAAAHDNDTELVRLLLAHGADPNQSRCCGPMPATTVLCLAVESGYVDLVRLLLEAGADPFETRRGESLIFEVPFAPDERQAALLELLLAAGLDIDGRNGSGDTPLICAIRAQSQATVRALLEAGADPTMPDAAGRAPLEHAKEVPLLFEWDAERKSSIERLIREALAER